MKLVKTRYPKRNNDFKKINLPPLKQIKNALTNGVVYSKEDDELVGFSGASICHGLFLGNSQDGSRTCMHITGDSDIFVETIRGISYLRTLGFREFDEIDIVRTWLGKIAAKDTARRIFLTLKFLGMEARVTTVEQRIRRGFFLDGEFRRVKTGMELDEERAQKAISDAWGRQTRKRLLDEETGEIIDVEPLEISPGVKAFELRENIRRARFAVNLEVPDDFQLDAAEIIKFPIQRNHRIELQMERAGGKRYVRVRSPYTAPRSRRVVQETAFLIHSQINQ